MPFMSRRLADTLHMGKLTWAELASRDIVKAGDSVDTPELLFDKIDDEAIDAQIDRLARIKRENELKNFKPAEVQPATDFETFSRIDVRVGTVISCEKVKKSKKLLRFLIDDGIGQRTILSGIAEHYQPEELIGRQVCFIANFPPRQMMGIDSEGMILSAMNADGSLSVITPSTKVVNGAQVK